MRTNIEMSRGGARSAVRTHARTSSADNEWRPQGEHTTEMTIVGGGANYVNKNDSSNPETMCHLRARRSAAGGVRAWLCACLGLFSGTLRPIAIASRAEITQADVYPASGARVYHTDTRRTTHTTRPARARSHSLHTHTPPHAQRTLVSRGSRRTPRRDENYGWCLPLGLLRKTQAQFTRILAKWPSQGTCHR